MGCKTELSNLAGIVRTSILQIVIRIIFQDDDVEFLAYEIHRLLQCETGSANKTSECHVTVSTCVGTETTLPVHLLQG